MAVVFHNLSYDKSQIQSALSADGLCDETNTVYSLGLTEGDDCLKLTLVDGGVYDADQIANGVIVDTGVTSIEGTFGYLIAALAWILIPMGVRLE